MTEYSCEQNTRIDRDLYIPNGKVKLTNCAGGVTNWSNIYVFPSLTSQLVLGYEVSLPACESFMIAIFKSLIAIKISRDKYISQIERDASMLAEVILIEIFRSKSSKSKFRQVRKLFFLFTTCTSSLRRWIFYKNAEHDLCCDVIALDGSRYYMLLICSCNIVFIHHILF